MAGIEITVPKTRKFSNLSFISVTDEDRETYNKHFISRRDLEINAFMQNMYISPIIKVYQSQENELNKKLPEITIKVALNLSSDSDIKSEAPENFTEDLRKIINNYGYINGEFVPAMNAWLELREKVIERLQSTANTLEIIKQATSTTALISSVLEIARGVGAFLYAYLSIDLKPKYSLPLTWLIGAVTVTGSVLALSYSKQVSEDIFKNLREEKYLLRDILIIDRKGNAIDEDVEDLFPHGIDVDLIKQIALDSDEKLMDDTSWKQYVTFAILLPNFKKNKRLIHDRKFLASVKLFVESSAAKIWFYRIKLRKLLDETATSLENHLDKKIFTENEVLNQAAVNLYPIFFPLFADSRNMEKLRFICSSMAAVTALVNLNQNSGEGFQHIRRTSQVLLKDYRNLRRFSQEFMNEYD